MRFRLAEIKGVEGTGKDRESRNHGPWQEGQERVTGNHCKKVMSKELQSNRVQFKRAWVEEEGEGETCTTGCPEIGGDLRAVRRLGGMGLGSWQY